MARRFESMGVPIHYTLHGEARAEGGDLLWLDHDMLAVGLGFRTNAEGLSLVYRLAERMNSEWDAGLTVESTTDRRAVLDGADFVVCSIEVGPREELWRLDWEVTLRHGLRQPYAENGGPGGFAHAARNIPHILDIARDMERLCPAALFVNLSNPLPRLWRTAGGAAPPG